MAGPKQLEARDEALPVTDEKVETSVELEQ